MLDSDSIKNFLLKLIVFICLLLGMALWSYLPMELFRFNLDNFSTKMRIIYSLVCDIGYMVVIYFGYRKTVNKDFKNFFKDFSNNFETCFKYYFIGLIIMFISNLIINFCFSQAVAGNEESVRSYIDNYPLYMLFSVSIYAPFIEEIIFRKSIKDIILVRKKNNFTKYLYILTSGLFFAYMHLLGQVTQPIDYLYIIPYASLGIAFASLYYKTDNIFSTITLHAMHNTFTIILYFLIGGI